MPETDKPTLIERFKADNNLYDLLTKYGYKKVTDDDYVSPNSQSGHKVKLTEDKSAIMSLSGSDEGIGTESKNGAWLANSFDLFLHYTWYSKVNHMFLKYYFCYYCFVCFHILYNLNHLIFQ